jgi:hypothetical protein
VVKSPSIYQSAVDAHSAESLNRVAIFPPSKRKDVFFDDGHSFSIEIILFIEDTDLPGTKSPKERPMDSKTRKPSQAHKSVLNCFVGFTNAVRNAR